MTELSTVFVKKHFSTYAKELYSLPQTRDISEEKLKSRDLGIELPKFSGYGSTVAKSRV